MSGHSRHDVLARIIGNPQLARAVPLLRPDVLHAVIAHCGLQDCGELIALTTPGQLSAVFDLDLWKANRAGTEEHFDAARFCDWLELLVDAGPTIAAARLATMDVSLVVAGLSFSIRVFDAAVFSPAVEPGGADAVLNAGRERGVHAPWRVRSRLDVLAPLDQPARAALKALFDECPVMLANVSASGDRRPMRLNVSEFQFIAHAGHIAAVHEFLLSLTDLLGW